MEIYHTLGPLILGSRLRRLSEYFIAEVNKVYQEQGIDFDASWFPVFYLLSENPLVSIREISNTLQVSHSAASQLISNLRRRDLVDSAVSDNDARRQMVRLSADGMELLRRIRPIWDSISSIFIQLQDQDEAMACFMPGVSAMEQLFAEKSLSTRIIESSSTSVS